MMKPIPVISIESGEHPKTKTYPSEMYFRYPFYGQWYVYILKPKYLDELSFLLDVPQEKIPISLRVVEAPDSDRAQRLKKHTVEIHHATYQTLAELPTRMGICLAALEIQATRRGLRDVLWGTSFANNPKDSIRIALALITSGQSEASDDVVRTILLPAIDKMLTSKSDSLTQLERVRLGFIDGHGKVTAAGAFYDILVDEVRYAYYHFDPHAATNWYIDPLSANMLKRLSIEGMIDPDTFNRLLVGQPPLKPSRPKYLLRDFDAASKGAIRDLIATVSAYKELSPLQITYHVLNAMCEVCDLDKLVLKPTTTTDRLELYKEILAYCSDSDTPIDLEPEFKYKDKGIDYWRRVVNIRQNEPDWMIMIYLLLRNDHVIHEVKTAVPSSMDGFAGVAIAYIKHYIQEIVNGAELYISSVTWDDIKDPYEQHPPAFPT